MPREKWPYHGVKILLSGEKNGQMTSGGSALANGDSCDGIRKTVTAFASKPVQTGHITRSGKARHYRMHNYLWRMAVYDERLL